MRHAKGKMVPLSEEDEESVYFREAREHLVEDDVLNLKDDGFMQGYETSFPEEDEEDRWMLNKDELEEVW